MPKNKGRGGKKYKRGKHSGHVMRELFTKEEDEGLEYGAFYEFVGSKAAFLIYNIIFHQPH